MRVVLYALPVLSFLLLGAHFFRESAWVLAAACGVLAVLVTWRHASVQRLLQAALVLGTLEWVWTAIVLVQQRMAEGRAWGRMAVILGVVALVTAASVAAMEALRRR
jgi:hypothetical protein